MDFKVVIFSIACFAFFVQPAQSGSIGFAVLNTAGDLASIGANALKTKAGAMLRGVTDIGSIMTTGVGLKVGALAKASNTIAGGVSDAFIGVGNSINKLGNSIAQSLSRDAIAARSFDRTLVDFPVVQEYLKVNEPIMVEENIKEAFVVPSESIRTVVREPVTVVESSARRLPFIGGIPSTWSVLSSGRPIFNGLTGILGFGAFRQAGAPFVYEFVEKPRAIQSEAVETFQFQ